MAKCGCGRSATGECIGLHKLTNEAWLKQLEESKKEAVPVVLTETQK